MPPDVIERELAKMERPVERLIEIEDEDEGRAVRLFQGLATQWSYSVVGAVGVISRMATGLRYEAIPVVAAALGLTVDRQMFADLQLIEAEALTVMARG